MYQQLTTEARWAVLLTLIYLLGWVGFAYFSPQGRGIFGFPIWFELSCIFLPVLFSIIATIVVKKVYKNIDLEVNNE
ncbi:Predicted membrane protein [Mannheimia haemolytica]|uniref:Predicted membrane protein n=1 Tax=Mannheimia haemolytica TaxID=75985 RepID=A0A448T8V4_MANHA|nr:DUF997 family protein [Mannheimia haemolytica]VEI76379.1 Predicted membrane protein [Mannheimia haemolytica]HDV7283663.1 DUF997 family protein [Mannheimia haemolytica]